MLFRMISDNAKPLFRQEWERIAVGGKVEITEVSYVYIARKPE